jgi:hypothetical protein
MWYYLMSSVAPESHSQMIASKTLRRLSQIHLYNKVETTKKTFEQSPNSSPTSRYHYEKNLNAQYVLANRHSKSLYTSDVMAHFPPITLHSLTLNNHTLRLSNHTQAHRRHNPPFRIRIPSPARRRPLFATHTNSITLHTIVCVLRVL